MISRRMLAVVAVATVACGRIEFDPLGDGRLQKRAYEIEGAQQYAYTFDLLREEQCGPQRWDDGRVRCTPNPFDAAYSDAGCSQPIGVRGEVGRYHAEFTQTPTDTTLRRLWRATEPLAVSEYYMLNYDECVGPLQTTTALALAEVAASELVELDIVEPGPIGRLVQQYLQEPGGIRLNWTFRDTVLGLRCFPGGWGIDAPSYACQPVIPMGNESQQYYDEPTCTSRVAAYGIDRPVNYFSVNSDGCIETPDTIHENLGLSPSALLYRNDSTCAAVGTYSGMILRLGPALDVPLFTRTITPRPGRIATITYTSGAVTTAPFGLYDTQWGIPCNPIGDDDAIECRPISADPLTRYTDPGCTDAIPVVLVAGCGSPDIPTLASFGGELREVSAEFTAPLYHDPGSGCTLFTSPARRFTLGPVAAFTPATGRVVVMP